MIKETGSGGSAISRKNKSLSGTHNSSFENKKVNNNEFDKSNNNKIFSGD
jgi:hypothetical protein